MASLKINNDIHSSTLDKPCISCRRRKVKCSKTQPCSNCSRSRQLCLYDGDDPEPDIAKQSTENYSSTDREVRDRLARLEKLMEMMMVRESREVATRLSPEIAAAEDTLSHAAHRPSLSPSYSQPLQTRTAPSFETSNAVVGQILFQEYYSAYFDSDFWAGIVTEIEDPRRLFDPPTKQSSPSWASLSTLGMFPLPSADLSYGQPTIQESNLLCKLFFENVNPFVRVLHEAHFGRELDRYRRGRLDMPREFEALLSAIYLLTINSLRPEIVQIVFSTSKNTLVAQYQHSCQSALAKVDFYKTDKVHTLQALLYYLTFLFQQNLYPDAKALLGIASRLAQTMGHHRDPSHFPYSPWVCEIRRRIWNHLCCLDAMALSFYGAESCLPGTSDAEPHQNANEIDWRTSRFATPSSVPSSSGFTDMTFVLVHRVIADMTRTLARVSPLDFERKEAILHQTETDLQNKYLHNTGDPSYRVAAAFVEVRFASLRLANHYRQTQKATTQPLDPARHKVFIAAVELLEAFEYHSKTFASNNWDWIFSTIVPWLALAIVLTSLPHATQKPDIDRAQWQIDLHFRRFSDPDMPVSGTPMWKLLVQLRETIQVSPSPSLDIQGNTILGSDQPLQNVDAVAFAGDLMLESDLYPMGSESFMYEDQFMQDLPWLNTQMPF